MTGAPVLATAAALLGALGYGVASVLQGWAARRRHGPGVVLDPAYLSGLACDGVAWLCSLYALRSLPLFSVQAVLAGSIAVTVVLGHVVLGQHLRRRDVLAAGTIVAALVLVVAADGGQSTAAAPSWFVAATLVAVPTLAVILLALYQRGSLVLATVAGTAFSGAAVCARSLSGSPLQPDLLLHPLTWALVCFGALGALAYARSLERGPVGPATAVLWLVEVALPGVVGLVVLGDRVRPGWAPGAVVGVGVAVAACAVLSVGRAPADPARP